MSAAIAGIRYKRILPPFFNRLSYLPGSLEAPVGCGLIVDIAVSEWYGVLAAA